MKKSIFLIIVIFNLISCTKEEFDIINLNGNKIISLGHAGMGSGGTYPMNSFESILKCINLGMDGTEFDVQMTKDSVLVAFHDEDLNDITNMSGIISSLHWSDVDKAHYTETPYLNYSVVSLEQLFSNINNVENYKFTFDCKLYTENSDQNKFYLSYINAVDRIIQKHQLADNVYIESQSVEFLRLFKNEKPNYKLFIYTSLFEDAIDIATNLDLYGITMSTREISKEQIEIAHSNNLYVAIWNIHSNSDNIDAINKNPDFIQTNEVKSLIKLLDL